MSRAEPHCFTEASLQRVPDEVLAGLAATDAEREAATAATKWLMKTPDARDADGPLTHGWACHAAFIAGVNWERKRKGGE